MFHTVPLSRNLGALSSQNPLGLFRPVMGQLYLYICFIHQTTQCHIPDDHNKNTHIHENITVHYRHVMLLNSCWFLCCCPPGVNTDEKYFIRK